MFNLSGMLAYNSGVHPYNTCTMSGSDSLQPTSYYPQNGIMHLDNLHHHFGVSNLPYCPEMRCSIEAFLNKCISSSNFCTHSGIAGQNSGGRTRGGKIPASQSVVSSLAPSTAAVESAQHYLAGESNRAPSCP